VEPFPHSDAFVASPELHPDLGEVAFLLGIWRGEGDGEWPSTEPFRYGEEVAFEDVGDNYLVYTQRSWALDDGSPVHLERGFVRPAGPGRVELVLAHPLGITEIAEGSVADEVVEVASTVVGLTTTAGPVTELRRRIEVRGGEMVNETHMAMRDVALMSHVRARLGRVTSG
jgi:THAP4-like, heme-binding beta-barrel domain